MSNTIPVKFGKSIKYCSFRWQDNRLQVYVYSANAWLWAKRTEQTTQYKERVFVTVPLMEYALSLH